MFGSFSSLECLVNPDRSSVDDVLGNAKNVLGFRLTHESDLQKITLRGGYKFRTPIC